MGRATFRKQITSPELIASINPKNIELLENFLKTKELTSSQKTITVYRGNLNIFFVWNSQFNKNKFFVEIKKIEFANFFSYISLELKIGSSRINNIRSTLSSFSNFIERFHGDEEFPTFRNIILKTIESSPKELRREKTILTDLQIEELLEHLKETNTQRACWLALAVTSGARFAELLKFETDMIDENRTAFGDLFLETTRMLKTKGRGRGGKLLYKYIVRDKFLPFYKPWLEERKTLLEKKGMVHNFLFIKQDGNPATPATIRGWVAEFEKYLKVPFYAHSCRHFLTTLLSRKNIPPILIKEIMGWSSLELIQIYDDTTARDREYPELDAFKGVL